MPLFIKNLAYFLSDSRILANYSLLLNSTLAIFIEVI